MVRYENWSERRRLNEVHRLLPRLWFFCSSSGDTKQMKPQYLNTISSHDGNWQKHIRQEDTWQTNEKITKRLKKLIIFINKSKSAVGSLCAKKKKIPVSTSNAWATWRTEANTYNHVYLAARWKFKLPWPKPAFSHENMVNLLHCRGLEALTHFTVCILLSSLFPEHQLNHRANK